MFPKFPQFPLPTYINIKHGRKPHPEVPVERALALEGLGAERAGVRAALGVRALVHLQVGAVVERLGALRARERALRRVRALVVHQERVALHTRTHTHMDRF